MKIHKIIIPLLLTLLITACSSHPKSYTIIVPTDSVKLIKKGKHPYLLIGKEKYKISDSFISSVNRKIIQRNTQDAFLSEQKDQNFQIKFEPNIIEKPNSAKGYIVKGYTVSDINLIKEDCGTTECIHTVIVQPYKQLRSNWSTKGEYLQTVIYSPINKNETTIPITKLNAKWGMRYKVKARYHPYSEGGQYEVIKILKHGFSPVRFTLKGYLMNLNAKQLKPNHFLLYNDLKIVIKDQRLSQSFSKLTQEAKKRKRTYLHSLSNNSSRYYPYQRLELSFKPMPDWENQNFKAVELTSITKKSIRSIHKIIETDSLQTN